MADDATDDCHAGPGAGVSSMVKPSSSGWGVPSRAARPPIRPPLGCQVSSIQPSAACIGARPRILGRRTAQMTRAHPTMGTGPIHDHLPMVLIRRKPRPTATAICAEA